MGLSRWYKTWRHGRGFGVHSPLAYRLVTEVLRPQRRVRYYDESCAASLFRGRTRRRHAAMIMRLLGDRVPSSVAVIAADSDFDSWLTIVSATIPGAIVTRSLADPVQMAIVDAFDAAMDKRPVLDNSDKGAYTVFTRLDDPRVAEIFGRHYVDGDFGGLIIDSRRSAAVCIERRGLPRQYIAARF